MSTPPPSDGPDAEESQLPDGPLPVSSRITKGGGAGVTALGAAMIAVGEILEPEKTNVEMAQPADSTDDDSDLELSFGDLPPIEDL